MMTSPSADEPSLESTDAPEEPNELRSQPLSPVSPKPIHYSTPSNIPILEHQLDQSFDVPSIDALSPHNSSSAAGALTQPLRPAQVSSIDATATNLPDGAQIAKSSPHLSSDATGEPSNRPALAAAQGLASTLSAGGEHSGIPMSRSLSDDFVYNPSENTAEPAAPASEPAASPAMHNGVTPHMETSTQIDAQHEQRSIGTSQAGTVQIGATDIQALLDQIAASAAAAPGASAATQAGSEAAQIFLNQPHTHATQRNGAGPQHQNPMEETGKQESSSNGDQMVLSNAQQFPDQELTRPNEQFGVQPNESSAVGGGEADYALSTGGKNESNQGSSRSSKGRQDEDAPWGPETQKIYDSFLEDERRYVSDGKWENFPAGSRLFIGNLPSERVTKRDIFHVFHRFGKLAQISIKQAYGFVQFVERDACQRAHDLQQGVLIRGKKVNLEISKPQRNRNQNQRDRERDRGGAGRRSPSPRSRNGAGIDSYRGGGRRRSSSPQQQRRGGRERSPGRHRDRRRRSRSPAGERRKHHADDSDDDLPLPRRAPRDVPEIQIIAKDNLDPQFLRYIEDTFKASGVTASTLVLNPRLQEDSVIRRQMIEGVLAVLTVDGLSPITRKFRMLIFDRSRPDNVEFAQYADLELSHCTGLLQQARQRAGTFAPAAQYGIPAPPQPAGMPSMSAPYGAAMYPGAAPSMLGGPPSGTPLQSPGAGAIPDLNAILAQIGGQSSQQAPGPGLYGPSGQHSRQASYGGPGLGGSGYAGSHQAERGPMPPYQQPNNAGYGASGGQDMNTIMAQLSQYKGGR